MQVELENLLVAMGQTITPARVSDFGQGLLAGRGRHQRRGRRGPPGATCCALENEMNGTGTGIAPSLVERWAPRPVAPGDGHTVAVAAPVERPRRSGVVYGVVAFLAIAVAGGAAGYFVFFRGSPEELDPVAVDHALGGGEAVCAAAAPGQAR